MSSFADGSLLRTYHGIFIISKKLFKKLKCSYLGTFQIGQSMMGSLQIRLSSLFLENAVGIPAFHNRASKMTDSKRCGTKQFQNAPFDHGNTWFFMPEGDYTHNFGGGSKQAYGTKMTNKQIVARVSCWYRVYTRVSERTLIVIGRTLKANTIALKTVSQWGIWPI